MPDPITDPNADPASPTPVDVAAPASVENVLPNAAAMLAELGNADSGLSGTDDTPEDETQDDDQPKNAPVSWPAAGDSDPDPSAADSPAPGTPDVGRQHENQGRAARRDAEVKELRTAVEQTQQSVAQLVEAIKANPPAAAPAADGATPADATSLPPGIDEDTAELLKLSDEELEERVFDPTTRELVKLNRHLMTDFNQKIATIEQQVAPAARASADEASKAAWDADETVSDVNYEDAKAMAIPVFQQQIAANPDWTPEQKNAAADSTIRMAALNLRAAGKTKANADSNIQGQPAPPGFAAADGASVSPLGTRLSVDGGAPLGTPPGHNAPGAPTNLLTGDQLLGHLVETGQLNSLAQEIPDM